MEKCIDYSGKMIVIDGVDCSGKGKQVALLKEWAKKHNSIDFIFTEEPWRDSRSPNGIWIDRILRADHLGVTREIIPGKKGVDPKDLQTLYFGDRCVHWAKIILPNLVMSNTVVCDRERLSTYAYGHAFGVSIDEMTNWHKILPEPDLYFYIKVSPETIFDRKKQRNENEEYFEREDYLRKVIKSYDKVVDRKIINNLVIINGEDTPENIHNTVVATIEKRLNLLTN